MCGIAGKYNFKSGEAVHPELVGAMCHRLAHRGPDDFGVYTEGPLGLGHRRLSILDLSEMGHQPMGSSDGRFWITYNGEIYNFPELKRELEERGYGFKSNCDTEVILYLYMEHGENCLDYLRGMFALAVWDGKKRTLFLARDRIGKKPLYYYHDGKALIFASEIKAILADKAVDRRIDRTALRDYFMYRYVPDPKSIYEKIHKLEPGHFMFCGENGLRIKRYWDLSFGTASPMGEGELAGGLFTLLKESVGIRTISDVPLGAFLSGGIDSSVVVALMAMQSNDPVTTCSVGFDQERFNEIPYARMVAGAYETDHHEFTVRDNLTGLLEKLAWWFDEPFADASSIPTYHVCRLARKKVTVALSGDGGDENFAGYEKYRLDAVENSIRRRIPAGLRTSIFPMLTRILGAAGSGDGRSGNMARAATLLNTLSFEADYGFYLTNSIMGSSRWEYLINDDLARRTEGYDPFEHTRKHYGEADTDDHLSRILYTDLKTWLPGDILVKVDRMSMAHSLEVRAPLLDHRFIEYAASIPSRLKFRRGEKKYIFKRSFEKLLPEGILKRGKMGFTPPLSHWLRGEIRTFTGNVLFEKPAGLPAFFDMKAVKALWENHQSGAADHGQLLFSFLMFELWFRRFMD